MIISPAQFHTKWICSKLTMIYNRFNNKDHRQYQISLKRTDIPSHCSWVDWSTMSLNSSRHVFNLFLSPCVTMHANSLLSLSSSSSLESFGSIRAWKGHSSEHVHSWVQISQQLCFIFPIVVVPAPPLHDILQQCPSTTSFLTCSTLSNDWTHDPSGNLGTNTKWRCSLVHHVWLSHALESNHPYLPEVQGG